MPNLQYKVEAFPATATHLQLIILQQAIMWPQATLMVLQAKATTHRAATTMLQAAATMFLATHTAHQVIVIMLQVAATILRPKTIMLPVAVTMLQATVTKLQAKDTILHQLDIQALATQAPVVDLIQLLDLDTIHMTLMIIMEKMTTVR